MPRTLPKFAIFWLVVSSLIVAIDASYVLLQPATQNTNAVPYKFWDLYATYDKRYASQEDAFGYLQSSLNVFEIALALGVVVLDLFILNRAKKSSSSSIPLKLAIIQQMMVLYKTVIYLGLERGEGYHYTRHNSLADGVLMVLIPSSFWITVPAVVIWQCLGRLSVAAGQAVTAPPAKSKRA